jgi:heme exporter protein D
MNDPLELPLRDIHLPDSVAWWPLAYGWWALLAVLIILVLVAILLYQRNKLLRLSAITKAREELARITSEYQQNRDPLLLSRELSVLLRRLSISLFPRTEVASLTGSEWLKFLDSQVQGAPFTQGQGRMLIDAPYRQRVESDEVKNFVQQCQNWIDAVSSSGRKRA